MAGYRTEATARSSAPPEAIWALLADGPNWPTWTPIGAYKLERPGPADRDGLGSIRIFSTKRPTGTVHLREEIVEFEPGKRLRYVVHSGLPVRGYEGTVELFPDSDGTTITWSSVFEANPLLGRLVRRSLQGVVEACAKGLADRAAAA
ncbi:SRPBCC family protein [Yinghuangia sp. YIM S09857]|uniref:SRPBCC family protein n=1 Tax=Yinghuangia sp. YIM S09857 TaxID=3436929 RepID=UPI003F53C2FC